MPVQLMKLHSINDIVQVIDPFHPFFGWAGRIMTTNQVGMINTYGLAFIANGRSVFPQVLWFIETSLIPFEPIQPTTSPINEAEPEKKSNLILVGDN